MIIEKELILIKLLLKLSIPLIIFIGIFICFQTFIFNDKNYMTSNLSSFDQYTINNNNDSKSSDSFKHIGFLLLSDKNNEEHNDRSSSREIRKLIQNTSRCIRSKFLPIK